MNLKLKIIETNFIGCIRGQDIIWCKPGSSEYCISGALRSDGIRNCPPPFNDEPLMPYPQQSSQPQPRQKPQQPQAQPRPQPQSQSGSQIQFRLQFGNGGLPRNRIEHDLHIVTAFITFFVWNFI